MSYPPHSTLFASVVFADELARRMADAVLTAERLEPTDLVATDAAVTGAIIAPLLIELPAVRWDAPETDVAATADQRMSAITSWPVEGDVTALRWAPTEQWITTPPFAIVAAGRRIEVAQSGPDLTAQRVRGAGTTARRFVDAHLSYLAADLREWLPKLETTVLAAVRRRRQLLDRSSTLAGSAALEALAP